MPSQKPSSVHSQSSRSRSHTPTPRSPRPSSPLAIFVWRRRIWVESTFALSMLEPWEQILLLTIWAVLLILVLTGLYRYLPKHLLVMQRRGTYYLLGQERDFRSLWNWVPAAWGGATNYAIPTAGLEL